MCDDFEIVEKNVCSACKHSYEIYDLLSKEYENACKKKSKLVNKSGGLIMEDLKERLSRMIVAYTFDGKPVTEISKGNYKKPNRPINIVERKERAFMKKMIT